MTTDGVRAEPCNGEYRCKAAVHIHGCYADRGACDAPDIPRPVRACEACGFSPITGERFCVDCGFHHG